MIDEFRTNVGTPGFASQGFAYRLLTGGGGPPAPRAWLPSDLAVGPVAWYDIADAGTVTLSGSDITAVADKSGNGNNSTAVSGVTLGSINGVNAASYAAPEAGAYVAIATFNFKFAIWAARTTDTAYMPLGSAKTTSPTEWAVIVQDGSVSSPLNSPFDTLWVNGVGPGEVHRDQLHTFVSLQEDQIMACYSPTNPSWVDIRLFYHYTAPWQFAGEWGEFIFLDYLPTLEERQLLEGYLAHKWGMEAVIQATHPFRTAAPTVDSYFLDWGTVLDEYWDADNMIPYTSNRIDVATGLLQGIDMDLDANGVLVSPATAPYQYRNQYGIALQTLTTATTTSSTIGLITSDSAIVDIPASGVFAIYATAVHSAVTEAANRFLAAWGNSADSDLVVALRTELSDKFSAQVRSLGGGQNADTSAKPGTTLATPLSHVVLAADGTNLRMWINGDLVLEDLLSTSGGFAADRFAVGNLVRSAFSTASAVGLVGWGVAGGAKALALYDDPSQLLYFAETRYGHWNSRAPQTDLPLTLDLLARSRIVTDAVEGGTPQAWASAKYNCLAADTIVNTVTRSAEGGLEFTGTQYATLSGTTDNFQAITETGVFSLGIRVRVTNWAAGVQCFLQTKGTGRGIFFGVNSTADQVLFRAYNASNATLWDHVVACSSDGVEVDVMVIGDGTDSRLYLNGVLADTQPVALQAGTHQYAGHIARNTNVASGYLTGAINALVYAPATIDPTALRARLSVTG